MTQSPETAQSPLTLQTPPGDGDGGDEVEFCVGVGVGDEVDVAVGLAVGVDVEICVGVGVGDWVGVDVLPPLPPTGQIFQPLRVTLPSLSNEMDEMAVSASIDVMIVEELPE